MSLKYCCCAPTTKPRASSAASRLRAAAVMNGPLFSITHSARSPMAASVISAREGRFLALKENPDTIIFRLKKGRLVQESPRFPTPRRS